MIRTKPLLLILLCVSLSANAQSWKLMRYEVMGGIGTANMFGDIAGSPEANLLGLKDLFILQSRPSFTTAVRFKINHRFSARLNLIYGITTVKGKNSNVTEEIDNLRSTLTARSNIIEFSPQLEYYFLREERKAKSAAIFNRRGMVNNYATFSAYAFSGVGGVFYKSKLIDEAGNFTSLFPNHIHTSPGLTVVIPAGVGVKYIISGRYVIGFEIGGRYAFSDKLDTYMTPAGELNPESYPNGKTANDVYYFTSVNLSYKIRTARNGLPEFMNKRGPVSGFKLFDRPKNRKARSERAAKRSNPRALQSNPRLR
jgi:hypothetical protein